MGCKIVIFLLSMFLLPAVIADQMSSSNYGMTLLTLSTGGTDSSSDNYNADIVVGTITGAPSSDSYSLSSGFFYSESASQATTSASVSGGSSGGGIAGVSVISIGELITMHPLTFNMFPGNKIEFSLRGNKYLIQLTSLIDKQARFVTGNNPVFLSKGSTESIDINNDGINDIELSVLDMARNIVKVQLSVIPVVYSEQVRKDEVLPVKEISEELSEESAPEETMPPKSEENVVLTLRTIATNQKVYLFAILAVAVTLTAIAALMFWPRK